MKKLMKRATSAPTMRRNAMRTRVGKLSIVVLLLTVAAFGGSLFNAQIGIVQAQTLQPPDEVPVEQAGELSFRNVWQLTEAEYDALFYAEPEEVMAASADDAAHLAAFLASPYRIYMPQQSFQPQVSRRLGFGIAASANLANFPPAKNFRAGWYLDWGTRMNPYRPDGIEYTQIVRVHQDLECPIYTSRDREKCPYTVPHSYTVMPGRPAIVQAARRNPGSLWLIGNEMDRRDWAGGGQDEILPQLYADAYYEMYTLIKDADPTAKIAIGGIIQPTPLRLEYLSIVWDTYLEKYQTPMPVDVWNTHNFIIAEKARDYGADTPPGVGDDNTIGEYFYLRDENGDFILNEAGNPTRFPDHSYHIDLEIFDRQIRAFRAWMKERGQQNKPLIVSEYGVLHRNGDMFPSHAGQPPKYAYTDPAPVVNFMLSTFNYFLHTKDCSIGYLADDCRLVQAWNWFSLNQYGANEHNALVAPSGQLTPAGDHFGRYSREHIMPLSRYYPIPIPEFVP